MRSWQIKTEPKRGQKYQESQSKTHKVPNQKYASSKRPRQKQRRSQEYIEQGEQSKAGPYSHGTSFHLLKESKSLLPLKVI